ncbi:MAG: hypothetical protein JWL70_191 [Acidimicrobiia bacterium]|nr:hypothetical protein [Acidimicrobiia bacterium]
MEEIRECIGEAPWAAALFVCHGGLVRHTLPQFTVLAVTPERLWALTRDDRRVGLRYELLGSWGWTQVRMVVGRRNTCRLYLPDLAAAIQPAGDDGQFVIESILQRATAHDTGTNDAPDGGAEGDGAVG